MVRLVSGAREKGGDIKLCAVQPKVRKTLEMTNLLALFETYDSEAEAITAAYLAADTGSDVSAGHVGAAIQQEYRKLGRLVLEREVGPYFVRTAAVSSA